MIRILFTAACVLALAAPSLAEDYPYPNHVQSAFRTRALDAADLSVIHDWTVQISTVGDIKADRTVDASIVFREGDPAASVYLNGVKYDPAGRVELMKDMSEILRWYAFTGPFSAMPHPGGGWDFNSITDPAEMAAFYRRCGHDVNTVSYEYALWKAFPVRLKTIAECRDLWAKEETGEIKWNWATSRYESVPLGRRVPVTPAPAVDPRTLPKTPPAATAVVLPAGYATAQPCANGQCKQPAQYQSLTPRATPAAPYSGCDCAGGCACVGNRYYVCPTTHGGTCAVSGQTAPGQSCPNGQCPTTRHVGPQQSPQFGIAIPSGGRVEVRNVAGRGPTRVLLGTNGAPDVFLDGPRAPAPAVTGGCPGGVCPVPQKAFVR